MVWAILCGTGAHSAEHTYICQLSTTIYDCGFLAVPTQVTLFGADALEHAQLHDNLNQYAVAEVMYKQVSAVPNRLSIELSAGAVDG